MKVNLDTVLTNFEGKPYTESDRNITLGQVLVSCLDTNRSEGKMTMYMLAKRCAEGGIANFEEKDLTLLKHVTESEGIRSRFISSSCILVSPRLGWPSKQDWNILY